MPKDAIRFDFIGKRKIFVGLSLALVLLSFAVIMQRGLNYGIDFQGGTEVQVQFDKPVAVADIRQALAKIEMNDARVQRMGKADENEFLFRLNRSSSNPERFDADFRAVLNKYLSNNPVKKIRYVVDRVYITFTSPIEPELLKKAVQSVGGSELTLHDVALFGKADSHEYVINYSGLSKNLMMALTQQFPDNQLTLRKDDTVGPKVGRELRLKSITAVIVSLILLLIYIWFRFDMEFAPGAIIALFHDVAITMGLFCVLGLQVDLTVLAALLTLVGYSLNDTIVVFDRIRENRHRLQGATLAHIINISINQTLSRTILTAGATMLVTTALMLLGGDVIRNFAIALTFGIFVGTYSSIYIASPITITLERWLKAKQS